MSESIYEVERAFLELREASKNSHWQTEVVRLAEQSIRERFDELEQAAARLSVERAEFRREADALRAQLSEVLATAMSEVARFTMPDLEDPDSWTDSVSRIWEHGYQRGILNGKQYAAPVPAAHGDSSTTLSKKLWSDCKTDKERADFILSGRAYETGVISHAIQADVAMAFHRLALLAAQQQKAGGE